MTSFNPAASPTNADGTPVTPAPVTPVSTEAVVEYGGRKYTVAEVLKKFEHGDTHIATLTKEREDDRKLIAEAAVALKTAVTAKDLLAAPAAAPAASPAAPAAPAASLTEADVERVLSAREVKAKEEANWKLAQDALTKTFGDQADKKATELAASIGMSFKDMIQMARTQPAAFKRLFPEAFTEPTTPSKGRVANPVNQAGVENALATAKLNAPIPGAGASGYWTEGASSRDQTAAYLKMLKDRS